MLDEGPKDSKIPKCIPGSRFSTQRLFCWKKKEFKLNPQGTSFRWGVWKGLLEIPYGTTMSYLEFSKKFGDVKVIRAVASANGKNQLWIVVPCHRVIGTYGSLTGYAGGLWRKKWLSEHENPTN